MPKRLAIIGAGPIGLEAALLGRERGFEVRVLERDAVGSSLRRWGATRFFSPAGMNLSARARAALGDKAPSADALLTGPEMAASVLDPIAASLGGVVRTGARVIAVGRARMTRTDHARHPVRHERAFRVLFETGGREEVLEADFVLDASGVFDLACALGNGGLPAIGERALGSRIVRDLGALHATRPRLAGGRVLLVGHGHSAANALGVFEALVREAPATRVTWATRSMNARPCQEVARDPLPERQAVVLRANALAEAPPAWLTVERRAHVEALEPSDDAIRVTLPGGREALVDEIVSLTGYRPDTSFLTELALDLSPVTEGAGPLERALANVADCLHVPAASPADLASGEPGFFLVGAKAFGRSRAFLLQTGIEQLETIFGMLA